MIESNERLSYEDIPQDHLRDLVNTAPVSGDGLPIYVGARVYVMIPKILLGGQSCPAVACLEVRGVGKDMVFFQHAQFKPATRVLGSRCYFDHLRAVEFIGEGLHALHAPEVSSHEILETLAPPMPGDAQRLDVVA